MPLSKIKSHKPIKTISKIDLPINEYMFKVVAYISAETEKDALNILGHLNSSSITLDVVPSFNEDESRKIN